MEALGRIARGKFFTGLELCRVSFYKGRKLSTGKILHGTLPWDKLSRGNFRWEQLSTRGWEEYMREEFFTEGELAA